MEPHDFKLLIACEACLRQTLVDQTGLKLDHVLNLGFAKPHLGGSTELSRLFRLFELERVAEVLTEGVGVVNFGDSQQISHS